MTDEPGTLQKLIKNNPHLDAVKKAKWVTHWALAPIMYVIFLVGSMITVQITGMLLGYGEDWLKECGDGLCMLTLGFGLILVVASLWVLVIERRSLKTLFPNFKRFIPRFLGGWVFGVACTFLVVLAIAATGNLTFNSDPATPTGLNTLPVVLLFVAAFMLQGSTEEIVTRGWLLQVMNRRTNIWVALIVTAFLFALMHGTDRPIAILNLILFSFFLASYILVQGNLAGACGWHAGWNVALGNFIGLPVSGQTEHGPTLLSLTATGPEWLTGGSYGPEASVITTAVLLSLIAFYVVKAKRMKPWPAPLAQPKVVTGGID